MPAPSGGFRRRATACFWAENSSAGRRIVSLKQLGKVLAPSSCFKVSLA